MKITIDLLGLHDHPDVGRSALVALMSVLPSDEVGLAVQEWHAVLAVRAADNRGDLPIDVQPAARETAQINQEVTGTVAPSAVPNAGTKLEDVLSAKTASALKRAGFQVLGDFETRSGDWLLGTVDRFGKAGLAELEAAMASAGLALSSEGGVPRAQPVSATPASHETDIDTGASDTLHFGDGGNPGVQKAKTDSQPNGSDSSASQFDGLSLRELCRHVGHEVGDARVFETIGKRKLADIPEAEVDAVRNAVLGLLP